MNRDILQTIDRRTWLAGCARTMAVGGMAATVGLLISRGQVRSCPRAAQACASCVELSHCDVPAAVVIRNHQAGQEAR